MSDIKIPSLDKTESALLILAAITVGYLAFRLYSAGGSIASSVGATVDKVTDAAGSVVDSVTGAWHSSAVGAASVGATLRREENLYMNTDDQSAAESARLRRQEDIADGPSWLESLLTKFSSTGMQDNTGVAPVQESPNAISEEWGGFDK